MVSKTPSKRARLAALSDMVMVEQWKHKWQPPKSP